MMFRKNQLMSAQTGKKEKGSKICLILAAPWDTPFLFSVLPCHCLGLAPNGQSFFYMLTKPVTGVLGQSSNSGAFNMSLAAIHLKESKQKEW
jgi:hypothetical protein